MQAAEMVDTNSTNSEAETSNKTQDEVKNMEEEVFPDDRAVAKTA